MGWLAFLRPGKLTSEDKSKSMSQCEAKWRAVFSRLCWRLQQIPKSHDLITSLLYCRNSRRLQGRGGVGDKRAVRQTVNELREHSMHMWAFAIKAKPVAKLLKEVWQKSRKRSRLTASHATATTTLYYSCYSSCVQTLGSVMHHEQRWVRERERESRSNVNREFWYVHKCRS